MRWTIAALAMGFAAVTPVSAQTSAQTSQGADQKPGEPPSLTDKLEQSEGVLKPPEGIDPHIAKPPPRTPAQMPVITPPGEPGGDQSVQPK